MSLTVNKLSELLILDRESENFYKPSKPDLTDSQKANTYNTFYCLVRDALKGTSLSGSCPMSIRHQIQAQHNYRAKENGVNNEENIRVRNLMSATLGFVLTLTARIIRVVLRTLLMPISLAYSFFQATKYGLDGWVLEDCRRFGNEWTDLTFTLLSLPIGVIHTFFPNAISLDWQRNYYVERIADVETKNQKFATKVEDYQEKKRANREAYEQVNSQPRQEPDNDL